MSTVQELITFANIQIDDNYEASTYYAWFQGALDDLSELCYKPETVDAVVTDGVIAVPEYFKSVIKVLNEDGTIVYTSLPVGYKQGTGYYVLGDSFHIVGIDDGVTLTILYEAYPEIIDKTPGQIPDIPIRYHPLLVSYAGREAMLLDDEVGYEDRYRMYDEEYSRGKLRFTEAMAKLRQKDVGSGVAWRVIR
jgi:hypothetical protein